MKHELEIPTIIGYCKNCFRPRRHASAYCGECQDEPERMKVYIDNTRNFPLLKKVVKHFKLKPIDLYHITFTYGDTVYSQEDLSTRLIAHELIHVFQQTKMGKDKWWDKYLKDKEFMLNQEVEAYQREYQVYNGISVEKGLDNLNNSATFLSGRTYGNIVSFEEAKKLIKK